METTEIETKFELTANDFACLAAIGRVRRRDEQLNVYYDTEWTLADRSATLRIRFNSKAHPVLTLKLPVAYRSEARVMKELELVLLQGSRLRSYHPKAIDVEHDLPDTFGQHLSCMGVRQLHRVGWVRTTRVVLEIDDLGCIELDRLELPDGSIIHEAEIESDDETLHSRLAERIRKYIPHARPSTLSKFQRFRIAATRTASEQHERRAKLNSPAL